MVVDYLSSKRPPHRQMIKSAFDYTTAIIILAFISPALTIVAIMIKVDSPGPVFFRQPRVGLENRLFIIWKFRTMYHEAADLDGTRLTTINDSRITKVGAWLRKWSIDEVPQLFNVLIGDMSLVGPRPHAVQANVGDAPYSEIVSGYDRRHCIKPGITGWAQVNGWRGKTEAAYQIERRVAHDLEYIERQSFLFDLRIIILTAVCLSGKDVF